MKLLMLGLALLAHEAFATTAAKRKVPLPQVFTNQIAPRDTLRAGQDIELRKVQAMLSGQSPKKAVNGDWRR